MKAGSFSPGGAIRKSGLEEVETCITWIQNTAAQYIAKWLILELFEEAEQQPGEYV